jgi:hypothetical protein
MAGLRESIIHSLDTAVLELKIGFTMQSES